MLPVFVLADNEPPPLPAAYYGTVTLNGQPAAVGTVITAKINEVLCGQITVKSPGQYGDPYSSEERLIVNGSWDNEGQTVTFTVNGVTTAESVTFSPGWVGKLNLTAGGAPDTTAPYWTDGVLSASNVTTDSLTLHWSGAGDNAGVIGYKVYQGDTLLTTVPVAGTSYQVTGLAEDTGYTFTVQAGDAAGNWSTDGPATTVTTAITELAPVFSSAATNAVGTGITVLFNKAMASPAGEQAQFSVLVNGKPNPVKTAVLNADPAKIDLALTSPVFRDDTITVSYTAGTVQSAEDHLLKSFAVKAVTNKSPVKITTSSVLVDVNSKNLAVIDTTPDTSITVPKGINDALINMVSMLNPPSEGEITTVPLPAINISSSTALAPDPVLVSIPAGTIVGADAESEWDGTIYLPSARPAVDVAIKSDPGKSVTINAVIETGYGDLPLTFSKAVRILIPGQAGKDAGYYENGVFTKITNVLTEDSQAASDALAANQEGRIDVGSDLVIWTRHMCEFVAYTQSTTVPFWTNGSLTASDITADSLTLSWSGAVDNVAVTGYRIYQDAKLITASPVTTTSYPVTGLTPGARYTFTVQAGDADGNWSTDGPVTTVNCQSTGLSLSLDKSSSLPGELVKASGTADPNAVVSIKVLNSDKKVVVYETATANAAGSYSVNLIIPANSQGDIAVVAECGNNTASETVTIIKPTVTGITPASGPAAGGTTVTITGTGFNGATAVDFGNVVATSFAVDSDTSITATSPAGTGTVDVTVTGSGGTSAAGTGDQFTYISDTEPPQVLGIAPPDDTILGPSAQITVRAEDNVLLSSITLQYSTDSGVNWTDIAEINTDYKADFQWDLPAINGEVLVRAIARDSAGNLSDGTPVRTYTADTSGPNQVTDLTGTGSTTSVLLRWKYVPGNDFDHFLVERKDRPDGTFVCVGTVSDQLGLNVTGLASDTTYWFRVVAYDNLGNRGSVSDEIQVATAADNTAPVITGLSPSPGYFARQITLGATASDNVGVTSITFQNSTDLINWDDIVTLPLDYAPASASVSYQWDITAVAEGACYVRAVACDAAGNTSNTSDTAPYVEYRVDRTGPAQPAGLVATPTSGYITLTWGQNPEPDLAAYRVLRAVGTVDNGYTVVQDQLSSLGYQDYDVDAGATYYYQVIALDQAGNESDVAGPVSAGLLADTEAPSILSFYPAAGATMPANPEISILAADNYRLSLVTLEYQDAGDQTGSWVPIGSRELSAREQVVSFSWDTAGLSDGSYNLRAQASDLAGNVTVSDPVSYMLNVQPPAQPVLTAQPGGWRVDLSWTSGNESDLAGFRLYRGTTSGGPYQLIKETTGTAYADELLTPGRTYYYVVDVLDIYRNASRSAEVAVAPTSEDTYSPTAEAGDGLAAVVGAPVAFDGTLSRDNDRIDRYLWDFGDGSTASEAQPVHTYTAVGNYTVSMAVYDPAGNSAVDTVQVTVHSPQQVGTLGVRVLDDSSGVGIPGASVVIQTADGNTLKATTNSDGLADVVVAPGAYKVYAYITDYKPAAVDATVQPDQKTSATVRLKSGQLVVGQLTVKRMTLSEIVDAGIDVSAPENQWVYKFEVHLAFNNQPLPTTNFIVNGSGSFVGGTWAPLTIGGGGGGGGGDTYIAYPVAIPYENHPEVRPTIAYLVIPGEARWLKEFFDVGLSLENTADPEFTISSSTATLKLPDGLSLASLREPQSLQVDLGSIAGGESRQVKWIIRGDKKGYYNLEAEFNGTLQPFGDPVQTIFRTQEPFRVWGEDALKMHVDTQDRADQGYPYHVRFGLENVSDVPVYNAAIELKDESKQNYIYAPNQELVKTIQELPAGQTMWGNYWLIPGITGTLDLSQSYTLKTGGNASVQTDITRHAEPGNVPGVAPVLRQTRNGDGTVTLSWDAVDGATGYRIYTVRDDLKISTEAELVAEPEAGITTITIPEPNGPKDYILNIVTADGEQLRHAITGLSWCEKAGLPVITVDPVQVYVGQNTELLITVNNEGFPVAGGTVDVGDLATGIVLDANGQARVTVNPADIGAITINAYSSEHQWLVSKTINAVASTVDTVSPVWPPSARLSASDIGQTGLTLNWTEASDNVGVTDYRIYKNGAILATVTGTDYNVTGLDPGTVYTFKAEAGDAAGNWSDDGPSVSVSTAVYGSDTLIGISLDSTQYSLDAGTKHYMIVKATYSDGSYCDVTKYSTYQSSQPDIAMVDASGTVFGKTIGETVITATYGGNSASANVTVKEGCFIATAAYGSYLDPHVQVLRNFRDNVLLKFHLGKLFVAWYYRNSPPLAAVIAQNERLRILVRTALTPVIYAVEYPMASSVILLSAFYIILLEKRRRRVLS